MDLSPKTPLGPMDYQALDVVQPGSVVLFSAQLGDGDPLRWIGSDPQLQRWLRAHQDVTQVVRMWPVRGPDDPKRLALRIVKLHLQFPWIKWFQIANEPDIEWAPRSASLHGVGPRSWRRIGDWAEAVWWDVEWYRQHEPSAADIKLLFPPLAQGSPLDPEGVGYDALRPALELYLDHGDGLAGHEYWDRQDVYLVEDRWPDWLQRRLGDVPFFVTECGGRWQATASQMPSWAASWSTSRPALGRPSSRRLCSQVQAARSTSSTSSTAMAICAHTSLSGAASARSNVAPRCILSNPLGYAARVKPAPFDYVAPRTLGEAASTPLARRRATPRSWRWAEPDSAAELPPGTPGPAWSI